MNSQKESAIQYVSDKFNYLMTKQSDINEHFPALYTYAKQCNHVTEMGVRGVISTWALMASIPKKFVAYDIASCPVEEASNVAKDLDIDFKFIIADTINPDLQIEQTDLLLIDTWHVYDQLKLELKYHNTRVNKYIIMHDTTTFADVGETGEYDFYTNLLDKSGQKKGLWSAITEFLEENNQWQLKQRFYFNNGLTVLERIY